MMRVADYIVDRLYQEGVEHIFTVTGRGILFLSDAVARHNGLSAVSVHHEQAAAYAAVAYAQYREKTGACLVSTGCAGTNALTGLLCAWQDAVPCVFLSGQNMLHETSRYTGIALRTYGQQEADIVKLAEPLTKYAVMITEPDRIAYELDLALYLAHEGRKGPVWIDVPLDIQNMRVEPEALIRYVPQEKQEYMPSAEDMAYIKNALQKAERPVFLIGSGIRAAGAVDLFYDFLRKHPVPVVFDSAAADIYGLDNPYSIGVIGSPGGTRAGNFTVQNADLVLVAGCRLSPMTTGPVYDKFAREAKMIVVDIDRMEHTKNTVRIDRFVLADAGLFLNALDPVMPDWNISRWLEKCLHWKKIFPKCEEKYRKPGRVDLYHLADTLSAVLGEHAAFLCDAGIEELVCPAVVSFRKGQRCIHSASQGAMGFALPAAAGVYFAGADAVTAVIGDGSVMMNLQELQTISYYRIPVKIIITNNNCYAVIRKRQRELFRNRTIGTDSENGVSCPDFEQIARVFGIPYRKITDSSHLYRDLKCLSEMKGPVICEVLCVEEQEYICNGHARTALKKFVQRPLEDQAPFMDRELFLSEMIVEPVDL